MSSIFDSPVQENNEFVNRHIDLCEQIRLCDEAYYVFDEPIMTDSEYDKLFQEVVQLEVAYPYLKTDKSPTSKVSGRVQTGFKTGSHLKQMLSIRTETDHTDEGVMSFDKRVRRHLGLTESDPPVEYIGELKYDGLSLNLRYENSILVQALTRGDGDTGEDVTANVMFIEDIPKKLSTDHDNAPVFDVIEIRGEVLMFNEDFLRINSELRSQGKPPLSNLRNAAAGSLRQLDPKVTANRNLRFAAYGVGKVGSTKYFSKQLGEMTVSRDYFTRQSDVLTYLELSGFKSIYPNVITTDVKALVDFHQVYGHDKYGLPYDIDGVVYKVNDLNLQKKLGYTSREPRWAVAHKYLSNEQITRLTAIDVQVGRTGKLTPVARLQPVLIDGVTVTNSTLHNLFEIRRKDVRVGDNVIVRRAGDVIPEILTIKGLKRKKYLKNFKMPSHCPVCSGHVQRDKGSVHYRCTNKLLCSEQVKGRILHFVDKKNVFIRGLGPQTVDVLIHRQYVQTPVDIFKLKTSELERIGLGPKSAEKLMTTINDLRRLPLVKFLSGLGLEGYGPGKLEKLIKDVFKNHPDKAFKDPDPMTRTQPVVSRWFVEEVFDLLPKDKLMEIGLVNLDEYFNLGFEFML